MPTGNATPGTLSQGDEVEIEKKSQEVVSEDQSEEATEEAIVDESIRH